MAQGGNNFHRPVYVNVPTPSHRGQLGLHNHVPLASVAPQLSGGISQRPKAASERMADRYQRLEENRDAFSYDRQVQPETPTSSALRGAKPLGRYRLLFRGDP